jgi:competence protein ComGC
MLRVNCASPLVCQKLFCKLTIRPLLSKLDPFPAEWRHGEQNWSQIRLFLIELVVVMAILSVLAALAILFVPAMVDKARVATDRQNIAVLNKATQHYLFNATSPNAFEVVSETSTSRMVKLVEVGLLTEPVIRSKRTRFSMEHT